MLEMGAPGWYIFRITASLPRGGSLFSHLKSAFSGGRVNIYLSDDTHEELADWHTLDDALAYHMNHILEVAPHMTWGL